MTNKISLNTVNVSQNTVMYEYSITEGLSPYFCKGTPFFVEYMVDGTSLDLQQVPQSILAIPFVCNVLPIVWLTDSELVVPELDKDFYNSIPKFKQGYIDMHKDAAFKGTISVGKIVENTPAVTGRSACFFSGGVDAWCTLTRHLEEKPDLIAVWGADIQYDNVSGWDILRNELEESAHDLSLPFITVHSSFRKFINEAALDNAFFPILHDGWWHGAQHGIGLIGHAAPCNYLRGVTTQYIAASFSPEDGALSCASWPTIDNFVRYSGCKTVHDAFIQRQEKVEQIIRYRRQNHTDIKLHVCWQSVGGKNCCHCEKCYRTIMGIVLEGDTASQYAFPESDWSYSAMRDFMREHLAIPFDPVVAKYWKQLQFTFNKNRDMLRAKPYYNDIKWIETFDFDHPERYWKRRLKRAVGYPRIFARKVKGKIKHILGR